MDLDIVVIGGGAAGQAAGFAAAAVGAPAVLVERDLVGGECPFWACMPSKTLLNSEGATRVRSDVRLASRLGAARLDDLA